MFMKNKISRIMAISAVSLLAATGVANAETVTGTTSVTVQNGFDLAETTPLSFGTVVAIANSNTAADLATLQVDSDGVTADVATPGNVASIVPIVAGTPGVFTVTNAAPNTLLTITLPANGTAADLTDPSGTDANTFTLDFFERTIVTSGTAFTADTDATGTLAFNVGATLGTTTPAGGAASDATVPYENVTFTGSYTVMVEY